MKSATTNIKSHMMSEMNKGHLNYTNIETSISTLDRVNQLELELNTLKDQLKAHDEHSNCENNLLFLGIEENTYFIAEQAVRNIMKTMIFLPTQMPHLFHLNQLSELALATNKETDHARY